MNEWIVSVLLVVGAGFMLIAAVGLLRLPDLFMRMHASTKATSFGSLLMLLACAVHDGSAWTFGEVALVVIFVFQGSPVAADVIARAAYNLSVPLWSGTVIDELRADRERHSSDHASTQPTPPS